MKSSSRMEVLTALCWSVSNMAGLRHTRGRQKFQLLRKQRIFRALASLTKQGVFHGDVKPGSFLFACKARLTQMSHSRHGGFKYDSHQMHGSFGDSPFFRLYAS
uniref:Protein kinase domain-containing protein n=1 Tax=Opuntia streptacantha TaxID=393608 RepID=A0A7C8YQE3_OPUST